MPVFLGHRQIFAALALHRKEEKKTKLQTRLLNAFIEGCLSRLYDSDLFYSTPEILGAAAPGPD